MIEASRMSQIAGAVARKVPANGICKNKEETEFYEDIQGDYKVMQEMGIQMDLANEFPDVDPPKRE